MLDLNVLMRSPEFYPATVDFKRNLLYFVRLSRDVYRSAGWLAPGPTKLGPQALAINIDDILLYTQSIPRSSAKSHYILISAFCCSTLLARYLDMAPGCLVLREPSLLGQLALARNRMTGHSIGDESWEGIATLGLRLLARTFPDEGTVVIKAADVCNSLGPFLLAHDSESRILLLSVSLKTFILQVIKSKSRRSWLRERVRGWGPGLGSFPRLAAIDPKGLDDATASAYVWLINTAFWRELRAQDDPKRVLSIDGDHVAELPAAALPAITNFFGFALEKTRLEEMLADPLVTHHAKDASRPYDAAKRREELEELEHNFRNDVDRAVEWARTMHEELGFGALDPGAAVSV